MGKPASDLELNKPTMVNTGVLKDYQGQGLYTALLPKVIELLKEKGFQVIYSRHTATNNAVIIPKLRADFIITGLELSDTFGTLVNLSYHFNPVRRQVMDFRCGQSKLDNQLHPLLNCYQSSPGK